MPGRGSLVPRPATHWTLLQIPSAISLPMPAQASRSSSRIAPEIHREASDLNLQQTFLFSALAWFLIAIFGSLPFLLSPIPFSISDAFFESMSGITTTGATVITNFFTAFPIVGDKIVTLL